MKIPSIPIDELIYGEGCAFSPNSNKAYSNVICFFIVKKNLQFWFFFIINFEINLWFLV